MPMRPEGTYLCCAPISLNLAPGRVTLGALILVVLAIPVLIMTVAA